jgi:hypothetical protein
MDEGYNTKTHIFGDGYYQSWMWRYASTSEGRVKWVPVLDTNGAQIGLTSGVVGTRSLMNERPLHEIERCQEDELHMRIMKYESHGNYSDFWELAKELQKRENPDWIFTHCLPWEYANLCAMLFQANEELTGFPSTNLPSEVTAKLVSEVVTFSDPSGSPWYPLPCYPIDSMFNPQINLENWVSLTVSSDEMRKSSQSQLLPRSLENQTVLVNWILSKVMGDHKTLDSSDDQISNVLYYHSHYVYMFSIGEASGVELLTIFSMSLVLYYSSYLLEIQQLMHQLNLTCNMRCYEAALFDGGLDAESNALRAAIHHHTSNKHRGRIKLALSCILSDFFCDIFFSLRIIFSAMMTLANVMLVTLNHGVINVIFSILAISFLLNIDDHLMPVFTSVGFIESSPYQERLKPAFVSMILSEKEDLVLKSDENLSHFVSMKLSLRNFFILGRVKTWGGKIDNLRVSSGQRIVNFWSLLLTTGLFLVHQYLSFSVAVNSGQNNMLAQLTPIFNEFEGLPWVCLIALGLIFAVCAFNTVCYAGFIVLPALIQTGLGVVWVYGVIRNLTFLGILAWYSDCGPFDTFSTCFYRNVYSDALLIFPALVLQIFLCILRPVVLLSVCRDRPAEGEQEAGAGE